MYLRYYDDISYEFDLNGERHVLQSLAPFNIKTVFDVGANVGDWSKAAASLLPAAKIYAFELSESTRKILNANLSASQFVIPEFALGAEEGQIEYKDYGEGSTINTLVPTTFHDRGGRTFVKRSARLVTGDSYLDGLATRSIDLLKIDVEGAELHVLKGFEQALKTHRIRVIQFEYGYANGDAGHLMKMFYELLGGAGYEIGRIWTAGVKFAPFSYSMNDFSSGPNYLAVLRTENAILNALRSPV